MCSVEEEIQGWIVNETNGLTEGRLQKLPDISSISKLTQGRHRDIWDFVTKRVKSKQSAASIRKILQLRRAEKEKYPSLYDENDILKNKIGCCVDKLKFLEHSTISIEKDITSLNSLLKDKKEKNCILQQKCSTLELISLNLNEKNKSLNNIVDKLHPILINLFANEKTKCLNCSAKNTISKINPNLNDNLESIINIIVLKIKQKFLEKNVQSSTENLLTPVTSIMSSSLVADLVIQLKLITEQNSNFLQSNVDKMKKIDVVRMSEVHLQSMKQDLLDCYFHRNKIEYGRCKIEEDVDFQKDISTLQKDYLSLYIQNECLVDSIQYLEEQLTKERFMTNNLKEDNTKQMSLCSDITMIMNDFYNKLNVLNMSFYQMPQAFSSIKCSLKLCRIFIDTQMLYNIKCNKDDDLIGVSNEIDSNYKLYLELLKNKEILQDYLKDFTFVKLSIPPKILEFLDLEPYQNPHLLVEKIAEAKRKLCKEPNNLFYDADEIPTSKAKEMISSFENNMVNIEAVEKNLHEIKNNCKNLKVLLRDWWYQDAQYISTIEHHDKTLKMWLAILELME